MIDVIYTVCSSIEEARMIGKELVHQKHCACVNIIPKIESIYFWEGEIIEDREVLLLIKAPKMNFHEIESKIKELHSYVIPCILSFSSKYTNKEYLNWMQQYIKS
jgi:periplasmic divalent cation tolerance protein